MLDYGHMLQIKKRFELIKSEIINQILLLISGMKEFCSMSRFGMSFANQVFFIRNFNRHLKRWQGHFDQAMGETISISLGAQLS